MLTKLTVQNFRSIENCDVEFGPITIFFGPTSAGKSTLFYALLVLRNFILNPNQALDGLFNLGFQNLGGFESEIARNSVESQRPSTLLDYAAAAWLASGFRETVLAKEASSSGISRNPRTLRNCLSATSSPDPTQRSI